MSELFETIEMKADKAKAEAKNRAEADRVAHEARQEERKRSAQVKRKKAAVALLARVAFAVLLVVSVWAAGKFGLVAEQLTVWLYAAIGSWLAYWFGAFVQFMYCKGGLLEC